MFKRVSHATPNIFGVINSSRNSNSEIPATMYYNNNSKSYVYGIVNLFAEYFQSICSTDLICNMAVYA